VPSEDIKTVILRVLLYGCGTWSVTSREEHRLSVFENGALKKVFGPKGEEITTGWRELQIDERLGSYSSPNILRMIKPRTRRGAGKVAWTTQDRREMHSVF
jgi:hypothetical protein